LNGQSPYSATKIAADQLAYSFFTSFNLPVITLRPFNTYGPRQSARAVIPTIISQILANRKEIKLGSISPTRDFNYVTDTVAGFIAALETDQGVGEVVNIGSNYEISILDTVNLIGKLMGRNIDIISDEERFRPVKSEVDRLWACNKKAKSILNWEPQFLGLEGFEKGLLCTIKWFLDSKNNEQYKSDIYNI
jgi:dTDP-glucose 4,6-dehydratase